MEVCPQCNQPVKTTKTRLVQDDCGHVKCRMCLIAEENGCATCNAVAKDKNSQALVESKQSFEEPSPVLQSTVNGVIKFQETRNGFRKEVPNDLYLQISSTTETSDILKNSLQQHNSPPIGCTEPPPISVEVASPDSVNTPFTNAVTDLETDSVINESKVPLPKERDIKTDDDDMKRVKKKRSKLIMKNHIKKICDSPAQFKCEICNKTFKERCRIYYHNFCGSKDKPFKCEECDHSFVTRDHFVYHLRKHSGVRPFICDICGKNFINKPKLTRHMKIHTGDRPYMCQECGKCYADSTMLACHRNAHVNLRPYKCTSCDKSFTAKVYLKRHKIRHKGTKTEMCEVCGKMFYNKDTLNIHRQLHSKVRPFKCSVCNMSFHVKRELARHSHTHSSFKRYCCCECDVRFGRKDNLERHMKTAHLDIDCNTRSSVRRSRRKRRRLLPAPTCLEDLLSPLPTTSSEETLSTQQEQACSECDNNSRPLNSYVKVVKYQTDEMPPVEKESKMESHHPKFRQVIYSNFQINENFEQIPVLEAQEKTVRVSVINRALQNSVNNNIPATTDGEQFDTSPAVNMTNSNLNASSDNSVKSFHELGPVRFPETISSANESLTASSVQEYSINDKTSSFNENEVLEIINYAASAKSSFSNNYSMFDNSNCCITAKAVNNSTSESVDCAAPCESYSNTTLYHNFSPDKSIRESTFVLPTDRKSADVANVIHNNFLTQTVLSPNLYSNEPTSPSFNQELYDDMVKDLSIAPSINQTHLNTRNISNYQPQLFYNFDASIDEDLIDLTINSSFNQEPVNLTPASKSTSVLHITKNSPVKSQPTISEGTNRVRTITRTPETTVSGNTKASGNNTSASIAAAKLKLQPKVPIVVTDLH